MPPLQDPARYFRPNRIFYIKPRSMMSSTVDILDMTPHVSTPYGSATFTEDVKTVAKMLRPTTYLVITKHNVWGTRYLVSWGAPQPRPRLHPQNSIAEIKFPAWTKDNRIIFTSSFSDDNHPPVTLSPQSLLSRGMKFVVDSLPYYWSMDSTWHSKHTTLYRSDSNRENAIEGNVCARSVQSSRSSSAGAVVVVDTRKIDEVVALLTAWMVIKTVERRRR